jgi:hypothetical protein
VCRQGALDECADLVRVWMAELEKFAHRVSQAALVL